MRSVRVVTTVTVVLLLALSACSGSSVGQGVRIAGSAFDDVARLTGRAARSVDISPGELKALSQRAGVSEEAIRAVAPSLQSQSRWRTSVGKLQQIRQAYGSEVADVSLGVACDGLTGEIDSPAAAAESLAENVAGLAEDELRALTEDTISLFTTLYDAKTSGDDQDKAAVALACYSAQHA